MKLPAPLICDAIKISYRQSKDGFVVSFAIHPQDMPADLANADIGSQWQIRLVGLDEDGNPKGGDVPDDGSRARNLETEIATTAKLPDRPRSVAPPASEARHPVRAPIAPERRMTQRAAILCKDPVFQTWLRETNTSWRIMMGTDEEKAALLVHVYCGVKSRREIVPGSAAAELWDQMVSKFYAWRDAPEMADA